MPVPSFMNNANFGSRAVAFAIDAIVLAIICFFLLFLSAGRLISTISIEEPLTIAFFSALYLLVFFVCIIFVHMGYCTLMHAWLGQTIGKMIMGIRVVTIDDRPVSPGVAFLRWAGYILSFAPAASGFLWAAVDKDHCAWHDRLAQTRVMSTEMT